MSDEKPGGAPVYDELTKYLQELVRIDTSNPPGGETAACEYLKEKLAAEGIASEIYESEPGRGSLVARIKGDGSKKPLLITGHLDVVPAEAEQWKHAPFCGDIIDGCVWGRGSLDCKNQVAVELQIMLELKRRGTKLKRDVVFLAVADEEQSGNLGMGYMVENHYDKFACEYSLNEGGGVGLPMGGKFVYTVQTAEKGVGWYKISTRGSSGHGSVPKADNAVVKLGRALMRLSHPQPVHKIPVVEKTVRGMAALLPFPQNIVFPWVFNPLLTDTILNLLRQQNEDIADNLSAMMRDTISPTILNAGYKENVIPGVASGVIDCRILPGQTHEKFMSIVKELSGVDEIEQIPGGVPQPTANEIDTELFRAIEKVTKKHDQSAVVLPFLSTGATDSRFLREKGVVALGYLPMKSTIGPDTYLPTIHSVDERMPLDALQFAFDGLWDIVMEMCC